MESREPLARVISADSREEEDEVEGRWRSVHARQSRVGKKSQRASAARPANDARENARCLFTRHVSCQNTMHACFALMSCLKQNRAACACAVHIL